MNGTELPGAGFHSLDEKTDHPFAHGGRRLPGPKIVPAPRLLRASDRSKQVRQGNPPSTVLLPGVEEQTKLCRAVEPGVIFSSQVRELAEMIDDRGLELLLEKRHELQADASTGTFAVAVRGVLAPDLTTVAKVGAKLGPAQSEQRAKNGAGFGMNASQSGQAGAAENVSQDSLGLVIGGVGHGNFIEFAFRDQPVEESVTRAAGRFFEVGLFPLGLAGDVFSVNKKWQMVSSGERGDKFFVGIGSAPTQLVIEMGDRQDNSPFFANFEQQEKKRNRVRAAGNCDPDAPAWLEKIGTSKRG